MFKWFFILYTFNRKNPNQKAPYLCLFDHRMQLKHARKKIERDWPAYQLTPLQNETEEEKELKSEKRKRTTELEVVQPKGVV
jgi:hypothetical protein